MTALAIWLVAAALYAWFRRFYDNRRPPLTAAEIDHFLPRLPEHARANTEEIATLRAFLERDDGGEFAMLNLVKLASEPVPHPETGAPTSGPDLLQSYSRVFVRALVRKGGHPAVVARVIGGYLDTWNVGPDPGWTIIGYMRYRSRRDLLELITDPRFANAHLFKIAATPVTMSFPTRPQILIYASPRITVGLAIALIAALSQLALG
ncbi:MAG: hypothetical protein FJ148_15515 [Deltaproteobacteria bacterium]|nr:hypothetical protein [Deltaproteobacteria bacterium]